MAEKLIDIGLTVDGKEYKIKVEGSTPLLWVLRDHLDLTHTKFGCGVSKCGSCTVIVDGKAIRGCSTPISALNNKSVTTIANQADNTLKKLQNAWIEEDVAQCGYCQPGQIMSALALLKTNSKPNEKDIEKAMDGNICRCGTYSKIKKAINIAAMEV